jgi:hypothetical protein
MLDKSIRTRKALVHSIPISEVIDMKSEVLWAVNLVCGLNFNKFQEREIAYTSNFFLQHFHRWDRFKKKIR